MLELYFYLSQDHDFLIDAHKEVIKTDEFIRKMVEIYEEIWKTGIPQSKVLITQRADYMCNVAKNPEGELKQVRACSLRGIYIVSGKWIYKLMVLDRSQQHCRQHGRTCSQSY